MSDSEFDDLYDRFEASWKSGSPQSIEECLEDISGPQRPVAFRGLFPLEVEYRLRAGENVSSEDYRQRFPDQEGWIATAIRKGKEQFSTAGDSRLQPTHIGEEMSSTEAETTGSQVTRSANIGPYKLLQQIGEGGMGSVYMAEQNEPVRRRVALKLIRPDLNGKDVLARFEAERQALALMDHPNIARVLDAGATKQGRPFFVMELVNGIPITEYSDKYRLGVDDRLQLFSQVCLGIQHAHQKGIIHRDVKPKNVLVTQHDGRPVAKVIDFGLAKALQSSQRLTDRTMFTEFGQVVGTLQYMSPEQAEMNALDIDTRSDVYSLGVLLYELLTGSTPIEKQRLKELALDRVLVTIREEEPQRPSLRLSSIGETATAISEQRQTDPRRLGTLLKGELDWIALKALAKDRERRYSTAGTLAEDVQRYLSGDAIEARPPSLTYRLRKIASRYRRAAATAAALFALQIIAFVTLTLVTQSQLSDTRDHYLEVEQELKNLARETKERQAAKTAAEVTLAKITNQMEEAEQRLASAKQDVAAAQQRVQRAESNLVAAVKSQEESLLLKAEAEAQVRNAEAKLAKTTHQMEQAELTAAAALKAKDELAVALEQARKAAYRDKIRIATNALNRNDFESYHAALKACPSDLRGWEHDYLFSLTAKHRKMTTTGTVVSTSPNFVAVGTTDGKLKVYDATTFVETREISVTDQPIQNLVLAQSGNRAFVQFLRNGKYNANGSLSEDYRLSSWDLRSGAKLGEWQIQGQVNEIRRDGRYLCIGSVTSTSVHSVSDSGQLVECLQLPHAKFGNFTWVGRQFLASQRARELDKMEAGQNSTEEALFSSVYCWDFPEVAGRASEPRVKAIGHQQIIGTERQDRVLVIRDRLRLEEFAIEKVQLAELPTREIAVAEPPVEDANSGSQTSYAYHSENRRLLVVNNRAARLQLFDCSSAPPSMTESVAGADILSAEFTPSGEHILVRRDNRVTEIYDAETLTALRAFGGRPSAYFAAGTIANNGKIAAMPSWESEASIKVVDLSPQPVEQIKGWGSDTQIVSATDENVYTVNAQGLISRLVVPANEQLTSCHSPKWAGAYSFGHYVGVLDEALLGVSTQRSGDGSTFQILEIRHTATGENLYSRRLVGPARFCALAWSKSANLLALFRDTEIAVWRLGGDESGVTVQESRRYRLKVPFSDSDWWPLLEFSPDGNYLAFASDKLWLWDLRMANDLAVGSQELDVVPTAMSFGPDSTSLYLASKQSAWGREPGRIERRTIPDLEIVWAAGYQKASTARCVAVDPKNRYVFSSAGMWISRTDYSEFVCEHKLWDARTGEELFDFTNVNWFQETPSHPVQWARFTEDSKAILTIDSKGVIHNLDASITMPDSKR